MKTKSIFKEMGLPMLLLVISIMFGLPNVSFGMNDSSKEEGTPLVVTLAESIAAGQWTDFDLTFTAPTDEYESLSIKISSPKGKDVLLKYESTPDAWILKDLQSSGSVAINGFACKTQTIKFKVATTATGDNSIKFEVTPFTSGGVGQPSTGTGETYTITKAYSTTGTCPVITLAPERLDFGTVNINTVNEKELTISVADLTEDITLACNKDVYVLSQTTISSTTIGNVVIKVTFTPTTAVSTAAVITITGGGMLREKMTFSLSGRGFNPDAPRLEFDKTVLSFESVNIGGSKEMEFTVTPHNLTSDITLSLTSGAADYTIDPTTISQTATGAQTVKVTFTPTMGKKINGTIKLVTSGLTHNVSLNGTGVYATLASTLPAELEVGKSTEFDMTFTKVAGSFETVDMELSTNFKAVALLAYYNEASGTWADLDLTSNSKAIIKDLAYETQTIKFKMTVQKVGGERLTCNFVNNKVSILSIYSNYKGIVVPNITVTPETLEFTAIVGTEVAAKTITVTAADLAADMVVTLTGTDAALFTQATVTGWNAKTGGTINIGYNPTAAGTHAATLAITSGDVTKTIAITATTTAPVPTITVTPETLEFTAIVGTEVAAKTITVTAADLAADMVVTLTGTDAALFTQATVTGWNAKTGGTINIGYNPTAAGTHAATLTITSGDVTKTVTITATATAAPVPTITVTPSNLDFNTVKFGASDPQALTITAKDLAADMLVEITGTDAALFSKTLANGWNAKTGGDINVIFTPTVNGTFTAKMTIKSGDVKKEVVLTGASNVGINELANGTQIFSFNKTITVKMNNTTDAKITVFDITGKMIANTLATSNATIIDVNSNAGIYIVNISANGSVVTKKVAIK